MDNSRLQPKLLARALFLLFIYDVLLLAIPSLSQTCDLSYECALDTYISDISSCRGDNSCRQIDVISNENSSSTFYCSAAFSCYKSNIIQDANLYCDGLYSCAQIDSIYMISGSVECRGELSCFGSTIDLSNTGQLWCEGTRSCAEATIYSTQTNSIWGYLAAQDATFYSMDDFVIYYFWGSNSGDDATIICQSGHTCGITCETNACNNLNIICDNCSNITTVCAGEENTNGGNICSLNTTYHVAYWGIISTYDLNKYGIDSTYYQLPDIEDNNNNIQLSNYDNSYRVCFDSELTNAFNCGDYQGCYNQGVNTEDDPGPICCGGQESCFSSHMESRIQLNNSYIQSVAIRCDGLQSCDDTSKIQAVNGGHIFLTAYESSYDSTSIITTSEYNIICSGSLSCESKILSNANNVVCGGYQGCYTSTLIENINNNVYGYGHESLKGSIIDNIGNNVYCGGWDACDSATINNVAGDVVGNGQHVLDSATISNVGNNVIAFGEYSLYDGSVNNATNVSCLGDNSCEMARITSVSSILAIGYDALSYSTIISDLSENLETDTLLIRIDGTNDERFNVYCNSTDTCWIDCKSKEACRNLYLFCYGTCYLRCDENRNIECPIFGVWKEWEFNTMEPTYIPSSYPTQMPTITRVNTTHITSTLITTAMNGGTTGIETSTSTTKAATTMAGDVTTTEEDSSDSGSANNNDDDDDDDDDELSSTNIAVLMIGITIFIVFAIIVFTYLFYAKHKKERESQNEHRTALRSAVVSESQHDGDDDAHSPLTGNNENEDGIAYNFETRNRVNTNTATNTNALLDGMARNETGYDDQELLDGVPEDDEIGNTPGGTWDDDNDNDNGDKLEMEEVNNNNNNNNNNNLMDGPGMNPIKSIQLTGVDDDHDSMDDE